MKIVSAGCSVDLSKIVWDARREPVSDPIDTLCARLNLEDPTLKAVQKKAGSKKSTATSARFSARGAKYIKEWQPMRVWGHRTRR